jgi:hypothetical protein
VPFRAAIIPAALLFVGVSLPADEPQDEEPVDNVTKNLVANGGFEDGDDAPKGWQTIDGLSSFHVKDADPKHGKVLKIDTDVYQSQAYDWWCEIARGSSPKKAPARTPTVGDKSDTLAGLDGAWFWSDPFPIEKGKSYWLTIDVKGPELMTWLVGYPEKPDTAFGADAGEFQEYFKVKQSGKPAPTGRDREAFPYKYVFRGQMKAGGDATNWKTYSRDKRAFRPTAVTPTVRWGRIVLLPHWPPAEYFIDNVKVVEIAESGDGKGDK